ncbi:sensor histidine kinase [Nocardioides sp.]|uniref:sensor histidine kinase n=1 Tax=Nocardioides sp. TaxID=35761 RepID=UPI003529A8A3
MDRSDPALWQPRLVWWQHGWRLVLMLAISAGTSIGAFTTLRDGHLMPWMALDLLVGVAGLVLVHVRRRWPVGVAVALALAGCVSASATGPGLLAGVSLATRRRWVEMVPVGLLVVASGEVYSWLVPADDGGLWWIDLTVSFLFTAAVLGWGMYLGSRRELLWALRQRAERAEAEQVLRATQAKSTERARIAREMHDVLAHRISQIAMQAGALSFREDLDAAQLRGGVGEIQAQAHLALTDLREVLGVLRDPDTGEPADRPQPTYDDVPRLVADCRAAGLAIELQDEVTARLPEALGRTVFRIVQEGITNARKHAPGAAVRVRVSGGPQEGVDVTVVNPLGFQVTPPPGSGLGLVGLTERAQLAGGTLRAVTRSGAFELHGWLPWAA